MTSANPGSVAVIGIGIQGGPIAQRLLAKGARVAVCDPDSAKCAALAGHGATIALTPAEAAHSSTVLVVVATEAQLRAVVWGEAGLLSVAGDTAMRRVAIMSTVPAAVVIEIGQAMAERGVALIDAPVSGGAQRALDGELTIIGGGSVADLADMAPVFGAIASHVFRCGDLGAGQMAKIVNNLLCHVNTVLTAEAFRLGLSAGLDPRIVTEMMEVSTGRNYMTKGQDGVTRSLHRHLGSRQQFDSILSILQKDTAIGADLVSATPDAYPMITGLARLLAGLGDETFETWTLVANTPPG